MTSLLTLSSLNSRNHHLILNEKKKRNMSEVNGKTVTQDFSLSGPFWIWELPGSGHTGPNSPQLCSGLHPATNYTVLWETSHVSSLMTPRLTDPPPPHPQSSTDDSLPAHCLTRLSGSDFHPRALSLVSPWRKSFFLDSELGGKKKSNPTKKPFKDPWYRISRSERKNICWFLLEGAGRHWLA